MIADLPADLRVPVYPQVLHRSPKLSCTSDKTSHLPLHSGTLLQLIYLRLGMIIRTIQELMGYEDISTSMIYTHVLNKSGHGVKSPVDGLQATLLCRSI